MVRSVGLYIFSDKYNEIYNNLFIVMKWDLKMNVFVIFYYVSLGKFKDILSGIMNDFFMKYNI